MNTTTAAIAALGATFCVLTAPAAAQDSAEPRAVIAAAAQAAQQLEGLSAVVSVRGEGSEMIRSTMPSITGRLTIGTHPEHGRTIHMIGEFTRIPDEAPVSYDIARTQDEIKWTDNEKQQVHYREPDVGSRDRSPVFAYLMPSPMIEETPYRSLLDDATSIDPEPQQTADGVLCDVFLVTYPPSDPRSRTAKRAHTKERWYIATTDKLPRRIEQVTDAGFIKASLIMELTNLRPGAQQPRDLEIFTPENYRVIDKRRKETPPPDADTDANASADKPAPAQPAAPPKPRVTLAPSFTMTDADGNTVSTQSQQGRTTVLAFGGSWCIPCRDLLPELDTLAADLADTTDVIYCAVRERDPDAAAEAHTDAAYRTVPQTPPGVVSSFKVRIYPTVVVIDESGALIYEGHITKDLSATDLAAAARDAAAGTETETTEP